MLSLILLVVQKLERLLLDKRDIFEGLGEGKEMIVSVVKLSL